jgi:thiosulfate/3-mercaptopyruvate sulfurtransferase
MGHKNVWVLDGGLPAWAKRSSCKKTKDEIYQSGNFKSNFNQMVKFTEDILKNIDTKLFFIDARSKDRFFSETAEPRAGLRSGHIPGSINIPYTDIVHDGYFYQRKLKEITNQENH